MNTLKVINKMLTTIGEAPVNTLDDPDELTAKAISMLDYETIVLQSSDLWFNHYPAVLPLDVNSEIVLPPNTVMVDANNTSIIQRGLKLYNKYNNTYVFATPLEVSLTVHLDFEEMPMTARLYVAATAVWLFETQEQADGSVSNILRFNLERAKNRFQDENLQQQNQNIYRNASVRPKYNRQILGSY